MEIYEENISTEDACRSLGSIQIVSDVTKHPNADKLELVTILGWQVVTRIGEVSKGDKVVYCEIDSMVPTEPDWVPPAVKDRSKGNEYFRIKTIQLRKEISQGLIVPITDSIKHMLDYNKGDDVTEELRIQKYSPALEKNTNNNGNKVKRPSTFPIHLVPKTDEIRIQSKPKLLDEIKIMRCYITEKLDGTSVTYLLDPTTEKLLVCSRNHIIPFDSDNNDNVYWKIAIKYNMDYLLRRVHRKLCVYVAIQGEICGPKRTGFLCF